MTPMMMTLETILISAPREGVRPVLIAGADRVLIDTSAKAVRNMEYAVRLQGAGSYVWAWLECSGTILRGGKTYQIWYVTRTGEDRRVIAEYVLEPDTDMDDFMIVVRNAITQYIDGASSWRGQCRWLYSV
jgi:hypothetical protein